MVAKRNLQATAIAIALAGCAGPAYVDVAQPQAVQAAQARAQFEFNCADAKTEVMSKQTVESPIRNARFAPPERAEYTIGATGCGKREVFIVVCTNGSGFVATAK